MSNNYWQTPDWLIDLITDFDWIALDPCTTYKNPTGAARYLTEDDDALHMDWGMGSDELIFMNPPFGRGQMKLWAAKLLEEVHIHGHAIVLCKMDTTIAIDMLMEYASAVCIPRSRINYIDPATGQEKRGADFPSWLIYIGDEVKKFSWVFDPALGRVLHT